MSGDGENTMTITTIFNQLTSGGAAGMWLMLLIILMSLIQISPLKLNPWDSVFRWLGKKMNSETDKQLKKW